MISLTLAFMAWGFYVNGFGTVWIPIAVSAVVALIKMEKLRRSAK